MKNIITIATVMALSGCGSTLQTSSYSDEALANELPTGTPIAIPKSSLQVTISYTLTQCKAIKENETTSLSLAYDTDVEIVPLLHPAKYVYIDPQEASKFNNQLTVQAFYHPNGMTQKLDIKGNDKTIDIAKSVAKSIVDISLATQGIPVIKSTGLTQDNKTLSCKYKEVKNAPKIDEISIVNFNELAASDGYNIAIDKKQFLEWVQLLEKGASKPIQSYPLELPTTPERTISIHLKSLIDGKETKDLAKQYDNQLSLLTKAKDNDGSKAKIIEGLPISVPGLGHLTVTNGHGEILKSTLSQHPELGHIAILNYETKVGKDNSFEYTAQATGELQAIKYAETSNNVSTGINDISKSVTTYKASKSTQEKEDEKDRIKAEAKLVTAKLLAISLSYEAKDVNSDIDIAKRIEILTPILVKIDLDIQAQLDVIKKLNTESKTNEELESALAYL
ncbi:hypothetical protein L4D11_18355 [Vibrio gigantis]|uniref:hypothetical protein n=1 Tax=Vibrio gigantis TaxID=296199 RepID=UPI003D12AA89